MADGLPSTLGHWLRFRNGKASPPRSPDGKFPVFGANGVIGRADQVNVDGAAIVIGRVGAHCGSTYFSAAPCWVTDNAIVATAASADETRFWFYALSSLRLGERSHGSGQPLLNQAILSSVEFAAPARAVRLGIAATVGALDDKIESNRRARSLIWDLLAAEYDRLTIDAATEVELRDLLTLAYGKSLPATARLAGAVPVYGSAGVTGTHSVALIDGPNVIVGRKGSIGEVHWSHVGSFPIDTTYYVVPVGGYPLLACYFALRNAGLPDKNSDSAVPGLNREAALSTRVVAPPAQTAQPWAASCRALLRESQHLEHEAELMGRLRDTILPELLAGRYGSYPSHVP